MEIPGVVCVLLFTSSVFGHYLDIDQPSADDSLRSKRNAEYNDIIMSAKENQIKSLTRELARVKKRVRALEQDTADFQQAFANAMKATEKKLSSVTCGCIKKMQQAEEPEEELTPCQKKKLAAAKAKAKMMMTTTTEATTPAELPSSTVAIDTEYLDSPVNDELARSVIAASYYGSKFFRYLLDDEKVVELEQERKVTQAMAFDPTTERIIWATYSPNAIYSSTVHGENFTLLQQDILCYGLAVDGVKGKVFVSAVTPRHSIGMMSADGDDYKLVTHVGRWGRPSRITLDVINEFIYVAFRNKIIKIDYEGKKHVSFIRGSFITGLTFDNASGILYFADRLQLKKVKDSEKHGRSKLVKKFKPRTGSFPSDMIIHEDNLYIGYKFKKVIDVLSVTNMTIQTIASVDGDFISMCIIP